MTINFPNILAGLSRSCADLSCNIVKPIDFESVFREGPFVSAKHGIIDRDPLLWAVSLMVKQFPYKK